jgi:hypothetical protein
MAVPDRFVLGIENQSKPCAQFALGAFFVGGTMAQNGEKEKAMPSPSQVGLIGVQELRGGLSKHPEG